MRLANWLERMAGHAESKYGVASAHRAAGSVQWNNLNWQNARLAAVRLCGYYDTRLQRAGHKKPEPSSILVAPIVPVRYIEATNRKGEPINRRILGCNVPVPKAQTGDSFTAAGNRCWQQPARRCVMKSNGCRWIQPLAIGQESKTSISIAGPTAPERGLRANNPDVLILTGWDYGA